MRNAAQLRHRPGNGCTATSDCDDFSGRDRDAARGRVRRFRHRLHRDRQRRAFGHQQAMRRRHRHFGFTRMADLPERDGRAALGDDPQFGRQRSRLEAMDAQLHQTIALVIAREHQRSRRIAFDPRDRELRRGRR